jgi:hypothetical protein
MPLRVWRWVRRFWSDIAGEGSAEAQRAGYFQDVQLRAWTAAKLEDVHTRLDMLEVKVDSLLESEDVHHHDD